MHAVPDRWDAETAAGLDEPGLLLYRSNLLGADLSITNFGGGNTSAKVVEPDPLTGDPVDVLWVKGSGGDLGSMGRDGFATLYLDKLKTLPERYRGREHEDEMVGLLRHCTFALNPRPASIDTPLHAYVPKAHVDHVHPDSVIGIAASRDGEVVTRDVFGGRIGWLPWQRPGFDLGMRLRELCEVQPELDGVVLGGHGLMTWGDTAEACYRITLWAINAAGEHLARATPTGNDGSPFGAEAVPARSPAERAAAVRRIAPALRGRLGQEQLVVGHFNDDADVLAFVGSARADELAARGTSCPDHFVRTKIRPLLLPDVPVDDAGVEGFVERVDTLLESYRSDYAAYYERCKHADSPAMRSPNPVVLLLPGVGMLTFAKDKAMARQASEFYVNAIHVIDAAERCGGYVGLAEQEAFDIEYWLLEEAKLRRLPPEQALSRRVALVTGAAGGIGRATARRLLEDRACVVLTDRDDARLAAVHAELGAIFGADVVRSIAGDVTDERAVDAVVAHAVAEYGGVDVVVCCAGLASAAPFEDTTLELWQRNLDVLTTGYFLVARAGFRVMQAQGTGGSIVFVGSKNGMAASAQASAYSTAKAAALHLARGIALEGAPLGIRCNTVNPDAVLRGSTIWNGEWREQRAAAYAIDETELEEFYRNRSMLKRSVLPEDVAEAVAFFATDESAKSTGNVLNVDAGNAGAFPR